MDSSMDDTIMTIAERLYGWSSEDHINLIIQKETPEVSDPIIRYYCFVIMTLGPLNSFLKIEDWKIRCVLCAGAGPSINEAKQDLLNRLLEKAKSALEVPVEQVMNS